MEGISKEWINTMLTKHADAVRQEEVAKLREEELERQRQNELRMREAEYRDRIEIDAKTRVIDLINTNPLLQNLPISHSDHWYESDEGIGESIDTKWTMINEDGVTILTKEMKIDKFGWSGSRITDSCYVWLLTDQIEKPVIASGARADILPYGFPVDMHRFKPSSWQAASSDIEKLIESLEHAELQKRSKALLEKNGEHVQTGISPTGERIKDQALTDSVILSVPNNQNLESFQLIQENDPHSGEVRSFSLIYKNVATMMSYSIRISPYNLCPWVDVRSNCAWHSISDNHLDQFKQGIDTIESLISST